MQYVSQLKPWEEERRKREEASAKRFEAKLESRNFNI